MSEKEPKKNNFSGVPMSEESYAEWRKAFDDMEECFKYLDEQNGAKK